MRRVVLWIGIGLGGLLVLAALAVVLVTNTDYGRERVRRFAQRAAQNAARHGIVRLGPISGNLLRGFTIAGITITDSAGRPFLSADTVSMGYGLRTLLAKRLYFRDVRFVRPVVVLERAPGQDWNYVTIFKSDTAAPTDTTRGFGDWIALRNVTVVDGHVTVRTAWSPSAKLTATQRDSAIRVATSAASRDSIVRVPGGYEKVQEYRQLYGTFPYMRLKDPDNPVQRIEVARARVLALPFKPPAADVRDLAGVFELTGDSLWFRNARVVMPRSTATVSGQYAFASGNTRIEAHAAPVTTADVRWLYPPAPPDGVATLDLAFTMRGDTMDIVARNADARLDQARVQGDLGVRMGGGAFALHDTDVRFANVSTTLIKQLAPAVTIPRAGVLSGHATLAGNGALLDVNTDVRFDDARDGRSRVLADGQVGFDGGLTARDLRVRAEPLQVALVRVAAPSLPIGGTIVGGVTLNGTLDRMLAARADLTHRDPRGGTSRVSGHGEIRRARNMWMDIDVDLRPVSVATLARFSPTLPIGGEISGPLHVRGTLQDLTLRGDLTHVDGGARSHVTADGAVRLGATKWVNVGLDLQPLSLVTVGRFAPAAGLQGSVRGPVRLRGTLADLDVRGDLRTPDGGRVVAEGTLDLLARDKAYALDVRTQLFNAHAVSSKAPAMTLTGEVRANGRGVDPATMQLGLDATLSASRYDTLLAVDTARVRLAIANGALRVDTASVRAEGGAAVDVAGTFGLREGQSGTLRYSLVVDTLSALRRFVPADTGRSPVRPEINARRLARARADSARIARATEVQRAATGAPPLPTLRPDTLAALRRDSLAGSLRASGTLTGNIKRFGATGQATATGLVVQGNRVARARASYELTDVLAPEARVQLVAHADSVVAGGFALDSADVRGSYRKPGGEATIALAKSTGEHYAARGDFTIHPDHNELHLAQLALQFDTTRWAATHPGAVQWGRPGILVRDLELRNGSTGRIYVNGTIPTATGSGSLDVAIDNFQVADALSLVQSDVPARGLFSADAHVGGTLQRPTLRGSLAFDEGIYRGTEVPDLHATLRYADATLTLERAEAARRGGRPMLTAQGTVPIYLGTDSAQTRLPDRPVALAVTIDSLPMELIPKFTDAVADVHGRTRGRVDVSGTVNAPRLAGGLTLTDGTARIVAAGVTLADMTGALRLAGDSIVIDSIVASSRGRILLRGGIGVATLTNPTFDLYLVSQNARLLDNDRGQIRADVGLAMRGPMNQLYVSGRVGVRNGTIYIPKPSDKKVISTGDPALFAVVDTSIAANRELLPAQSPLMSNLRMDVDVNIARDTWVRSADANVEIYTPADAGDLTVHVDERAQALTLIGEVDTDRGEYSFLSKRFQIRRGSATFIGSPTLNPLVQVSAEYEVRVPAQAALTIRVLIGGTALKPTLTLQSDAQPPISQSDLLSYLAFGRSSSSLLQFEGSSLSGGGGGTNNLAGAGATFLGQRLAAVALGTFVQELQGQATRELGLDYFDITPADLYTEVVQQRSLSTFLRGTEIEAGKYVDRNTFVAVRVNPLTVPGLQVQRRTGKGFRIEASYGPRFLPPPPSLNTRSLPAPARVLGLFLIREWRY